MDLAIGTQRLWVVMERVTKAASRDPGSTAPIR